MFYLLHYYINVNFRNSDNSQSVCVPIWPSRQFVHGPKCNLKKTSLYFSLKDWSTLFVCFALHKIYMWPMPFHFPIQTWKCTSILLFILKGQITPKKVEKNQCQFFCHMTSGIHWKIFATVFLCFIAGKCNSSVNIKLWCTCMIAQWIYRSEWYTLLYYKVILSIYVWFNPYWYSDNWLTEDYRLLACHVIGPGALQREKFI